MTAADEAGGWIAPRLGAFGTVGGAVPPCYEAYAAVPNADDGEGPAFALDQPLGGTGRSRLDALLGLLAPVTGAQDCCFAVWDGYGGMFREDDGSIAGFAVLVAWDGEGGRPDAAELERTRREAYAERARRLPARPPAAHLSLPYRDYYVLRGPLEPTARLFAGGAPGGAVLEVTPTLLWPADRSWFVATDLDSGSTLVAGPRRLLEPLTRAPWGGRWTEPGDPVWFVPGTV